MPRAQLKKIKSPGPRDRGFLLSAHGGSAPKPPEYFGKMKYALKADSPGNSPYHRSTGGIHMKVRPSATRRVPQG